MEKEDQPNAHFSSSVLCIPEVGAISIINAPRGQTPGQVTLRRTDAPDVRRRSGMALAINRWPQALMQADYSCDQSLKSMDSLGTPKSMRHAALLGFSSSDLTATVQRGRACKASTSVRKYASSTLEREWPRTTT